MVDEQRLLDRAIALLREPVDVGEGLEQRVMKEIAPLPVPSAPGPAVRFGAWLLRPHAITVRPVLPVAAAAALLMVAGVLTWRPGTDVAPPGVGAAPTDATPVRFVLVAPQATEVMLVGDFNDWAAGATPLRGSVSEGMWAVEVPLPPGRYRYAFIVDGATWVPDPTAPRAIDDDFGHPNSVLTIGGT